MMKKNLRLRCRLFFGLLFLKFVDLFSKTWHASFALGEFIKEVPLQSCLSFTENSMFSNLTFKKYYALVN